MAMSKHPSQAKLDREPRERVDEWAARQLVRDAVGESCARADRLEFVTMDPAAERTVDLFVDEQALWEVVGVPCQPADDASDPQFHFRAALNPAAAPYHADRGERRAQQGQRIVALVEAEDHRYGGVDLNLPDEGGHTS
jgi:hypothetical protein